MCASREPLVRGRKRCAVALATVHQHRRADAAWAHGVSVGVSARWRRQSCCARGAGGTRGAGCGFVEGQSIGAAPPREEPPCHLRLHRRGLARTQWSGVPEVKLWRIHQTRHSGRSGATSACPCDADGRRRTTPTGESARQLTVTALRHTVGRTPCRTRNTVRTVRCLCIMAGDQESCVR